MDDCVVRVQKQYDVSISRQQHDKHEACLPRYPINNNALEQLPFSSVPWDMFPGYT